MRWDIYIRDIVLSPSHNVMEVKQARYLYYYHVLLVSYFLIAMGYERRTSVCWTPFLGWSNAARLDASTHCSLAWDWPATSISSFCLLASQCMFMIPRHLSPPALAPSPRMVSISSCMNFILNPTSFKYTSVHAFVQPRIFKSLKDLICTASIFLFSL